MKFNKDRQTTRSIAKSDVGLKVWSDVMLEFGIFENFENLS